MLDLELILALMAWFAGGESKLDIPDVLWPPTADYTFSRTYTHRNAARAEIFLANAGESTAWVYISFLGAQNRELARNEIEIHPLEFPYIYTGLDLVEHDGEEITVQVSVEFEGPQDEARTDIEVYLRQKDEDKVLGEEFVPYSFCRRLAESGNGPSWSDC